MIYMAILRAQANFDRIYFQFTIHTKNDKGGQFCQEQHFNMSLACKNSTKSPIALNQNVVIPQIRLDNHVNSYSEIIPRVHCNFLSLISVAIWVISNLGTNLGLESFSGGRLVGLDNGWTQHKVYFQTCCNSIIY